MKIKDYRKKLNSSFHEESIPNVLENLKKTSVYENREFVCESKDERRISFGFIPRLAFVLVICFVIVLIGVNGPLKNGALEENNGVSNGESNDEARPEDVLGPSGENENVAGDASSEGAPGESSGKENENGFTSSDIDKGVLEDIKIYIYSNSATLEETILYANSQKYTISEKLLEEIYNNTIEENESNNGKPGE